MIGLLISVLASICSFYAYPARAASPDPVRVSDLVDCYKQLEPYTNTGSHATVYPGSEPLAFLPGSYGGKTGLWIYAPQGAAFAEISPGLAGKTIAFDINTGKRQETVIYEPAGADHGARVWLRGSVTSHGTGVKLLFSAEDDAGKRAPLEAELQKMASGMSKTWDMRESKLVKAVNEGKYVWVDVDVDDYKDAAAKCEKLLDAYPETGSLRSTVHSESDELARRARSGVVRDQHPSAFMSTPQY